MKNFILYGFLVVLLSIFSCKGNREKQAVSYISRTYVDCASKHIVLLKDGRPSYDDNIFEITCSERTYVIKCSDNGVHASCKTLTWFTKK